MLSMVLLDELDKKIIELLQRDARVKLTKLAEIMKKPEQQ